MDDSSVDLIALGARLRVDFSGVEADVVREFCRVWDFCLVPDPQVGGTEHTLVDAGSVMVGDIAPDTVSGDCSSQLLMRLTQRITGALIKAQAGRLLMLHAGALSHPGSGASLVYVAPGGTGKTTLTRTLGVGLGYVTDETVGMDEGNLIRPYPKPLSVRRDPYDGVKDERGPGDLGLLAPVATPWPAKVVILQRDPLANRLEVSDLSLLSALVALAPETSSLGLLDRPLQRLARLLDLTGGLSRLRYSEASQLADYVQQVLASAPAAAS